MVKVSSREGWISIGPWGGPQGEPWAYKPNEGCIKQIIVRHGCAVDSLLFQSQTSHGSVEYSNKFGGPGGSRTDKVCIDSPAEYITAIKMTMANSILFGNFSGQDVITSLSFVTNVTEYGPFGVKLGTFISIPVENGVIKGFHGRAGEFLNSIGIYTEPKKISCFCQMPVQEFESNQHQVIDGMKLLSLQDPGPWGGPGGNQWDDGVFSAVNQVHLYSNGNGSIQAIQLQYQKRDGEFVWSPRHGGPGGNLIEVDCTHGRYWLELKGSMVQLRRWGMALRQL